MEQRGYKLLLKFIAASICFFILHSDAFATSTEGIQVYQKNMHLSVVHKQKLAADIYRYYNADNLWDELRHEFILPHYEDSPQVQEQINYLINHQDFLVNSATRAAPYLYFILQQVRKRHLPAEFVLLPIMESAYNPFAYSLKGAAGIWQMMPGTASGFGIKQNWWYDGRRDVVASTCAALDYLAYLGNFFDGNWLLGTAAYDTGEGNVLSAIRKNINEGRNTDYWSLPLAQETRIYIPRLLALATIISHPEIFPIPFPPVRNAPYLAQVDIGAQIDLKHAAELAGLSLKKLKQLNPGYNRSSTDPNGPFKLVLPIEHVQQFTENLARSPLYQQLHWVRYKIKSHDTLASIAKRFNTSTSTLKKANPKLASHLKPGKHLMIPHSTPQISNTILASETEQPFFTSNDNINNSIQNTRKSTKTTKAINDIVLSLENLRGKKYKLQPGDTLYMARNNDNLQKIAKKFHTTVNTLIAINRLDTNKNVLPGDKLIIPTHLAAKNSTQTHSPATTGDIIYQVRKGDNIEKIARKFHTEPANIRLANLLTDNNLQEGDRIVIPPHIG